MTEQSGTSPAHPSPMQFFSTMNAFQQTAALKAAIELDLFTAIGEGNERVADIAKRCGASERGIGILCNYLTVLRFLQKSGDTFSLTQNSAIFLDRRSPACMADAARFLASPDLMRHFDDMAAVVRKGGTLSQQGSTEPDHPMWVDFARGMAPLMRPTAELMADQLARDLPQDAAILDIAAGHGVFGLSLASRLPQARVTALDWTAVLEVAKENAASAGMAGRYETIPGSAFDVEFNGPYDAVLLTNFLHHFDPVTCTQLLRKVHQSLKPGGLCATLEFVPNADKVTPPESAAFSIIMLASTPAGDAYSFEELEKMLLEAGFQDNRIIGLTPTPQSLVISKKA